jgi:hypothetical protein
VAGLPASQPPQGPLASYWDTEKGSLNFDKLTADFQARDAVFTKQTERAKSIPAKPEEYGADLPTDLKLPEGYQVKFDEKAIAEVQAIAHEAGVPKDAYAKLLATYVKHQHAADVASVAEHQAMVEAEIKKMGGGDAVKARRAPLETYIGANFAPDMQAEVRLLFATEAGTRVIEHFINAANGSAVPGRVPEGVPSAPALSMEDRWYTPRKAS